MKLHGLFAGVVLTLSFNTSAGIQTKEVEYRHGDVKLQGSIAYDDAIEGKMPTVLVVHEWTGYGPYVRKRAEQIAKLGYFAFAIDMYGKGVKASNHEEAAKLAGIYKNDRDLMRARAKAALDFIAKNERVDPKRIAATGYCFGGTTVLEMARAGFDLRGVASFHGGLETPKPEDTKKPKAKILILHGADDSFVNSSVQPFQEEMARVGADWQMISYGGAVHSFTVPEAGSDPSKGMAYNEAADRRSWNALVAFLSEIFL